MGAFVSMSGLDLSFMKEPSKKRGKRKPAAPVKAARAEPHPCRADFGFPMIRSDIQPYRSPIDGRMITSKSEHREHMKRHGVIEVGNELPKIEDKETKRRKRKASIRKDLTDAVQAYNQGFRNRPVEAAKDVVINAPVANGTVLRTDSPTKSLII